MARVRKTNSSVITDGEQKIVGLKSIGAAIDLKNGVSVKEGQDLLDAAQAALEEYNGALAAADAKQNVFVEAELALRAFNSKVLPAVGLVYGKDSSEYEAVGGTRESDRAKSVRKPKKT